MKLRINHRASSYSFLFFLAITISISTVLGQSSNILWPGDTNRDGIVNNEDMLGIGIAHGAVGIARDSMSIEFIPIPIDSFLWGVSLPVSGIDYAYMDYNGDGIINSLDKTAIEANYGFQHNDTTVSTSTTIYSGNHYLELCTRAMKDTIQKGDSIEIEITFGNLLFSPGTEKFLHEYESYLPGDVRDVMLAYNKALLWHAKGDYAKSMKALQSVETDDVFMTIDSKSLLIKIYYEQNENEALLNLMDSFRIFIQRNKIISTYHKNVRLNFIKFIRKLIKLPLGNKQYLLEIQDQIKKSSEVESKDWILKMIELKLN